MLGHGRGGLGALPKRHGTLKSRKAGGDCYNVFDKRIDRANSELSKGVLTETMTTENGASLSQSEVHLEVVKNLINKDANTLRDVYVTFECNSRKMIKHGFPLAGYRFDWYEGVITLPRKQQVAYERLVTGITMRRHFRYFM